MLTGVFPVSCQLMQAKQNIHFFKNKPIEVIESLKWPDLKFNNSILKRVTESKLLGVTINENLNQQSRIKLI